VGGRMVGRVVLTETVTLSTRSPSLFVSFISWDATKAPHAGLGGLHGTALKYHRAHVLQGEDQRVPVGPQSSPSWSPFLAIPFAAVVARTAPLASLPSAHHDETTGAGAAGAKGTAGPSHARAANSDRGEAAHGGEPCVASSPTLAPVGNVGIPDSLAISAIPNRAIALTLPSPSSSSSSPRLSPLLQPPPPPPPPPPLSLSPSTPTSPASTLQSTPSSSSSSASSSTRPGASSPGDTADDVICELGNAKFKRDFGWPAGSDGRATVGLRRFLALGCGSAEPGTQARTEGLWCKDGLSTAS